MFFDNLYGRSDALRIRVEFDDGASYITGTSGCASFPADADKFTDLFALVDKMLYLGKSSGRNCFNIYDEEKHRDIEIRKIASNGVFTDMHNIRIRMENKTGIHGKLRSVMPQLNSILQIQDLYYVLDDGRMHAVLDRDVDWDAHDIPELTRGDVFSENTLEPVRKNAPYLYSTLLDNGFESVMTVRIRRNTKVYGYLVCAVKRSLRIWQENECAIMYYIAELLSSDWKEERI